MTAVATGRCQCGAVSYKVSGPLRPVVACHCDMCRRLSGHFVAATAAMREHIQIANSESLHWYKSSDTARRGFCGICGSNLFWEGVGKPYISIMAGSLDKPTRLKLVRHIFTDHAGDYYQIPDDEPQQNDGNHGVAFPIS